MDKLISVISTALPVFLALAIGMMCRSKGFLTREGVDTLKKVIVRADPAGDHLHHLHDYAGAGLWLGESHEIRQ